MMTTIPDVEGFIVEVRRKNRDGQVGKKGFATDFTGFRVDGRTKVHYTDYKTFGDACIYGAEKAEQIACDVFRTTTRPIRLKVRPVDKNGDLIRKASPVMSLEREFEIRRRDI